MFYNKFAELCAAHRISPTAVSREVGFAKSNITAWKNGSAQPNSSVLAKIAKYFGVSADYFLETEPQKEKPPMTDGEIEMVLSLRELTKSELESVKNYVAFVKSQRKQ